MKRRSLAGSAMALLVAAPVVAQVPEQRSISVQNASGDALLCMVRAIGSSSAQRLFLKAGEAWRDDGGKDRRLRCEGSYSTWHRVSPGRTYALLKSGHQRIVVQQR